VQGHAQYLGLLLVGHGRLDGLRPGHDDGVVALGQQVVERLAFEVAPRQPWRDALRHVQDLDRHRHAVGQPQPSDRPHAVGRRHLQARPELRTRALLLEREHAAARLHAALAHVLGERGHGQRQRDLRLGDIGARAVAAQEHPLAHELVDRHAQRRPRHPELRGQAPLGRDRRPDLEAADELEQRVERELLLRRRSVLVYTTCHSCLPDAPCRAGGKLHPVERLVNTNLEPLPPMWLSYRR